MSKNPATCCNFTKSYSTLTNSYNTLCIAKHGILDPEYTEKLTASAGDFVLQTPYRGSALWGGGLVPPMLDINRRHCRYGHGSGQSIGFMYWLGCETAYCRDATCALGL